MYLIDDIDFVFAFGRAISNFFPDLTYIVYTIVGGRINLNYIHRSPGSNAPASGAFATRTSIYRMFTIDGFCKNLGYCGFSCSSRSAKQICMSYSISFDLVLQCCHNMFLSLDIFKFLRTELTV